MKKIFILTSVLLLTLTNTYASDDVVYLQTNEHYFHNASLDKDILQVANNEPSLFSEEDVDNDLLLDEDFTDNKLEKTFCKFINNKMKTKGVNLISLPIGN